MNLKEKLAKYACKIKENKNIAIACCSILIIIILLICLLSGKSNNAEVSQEKTDNTFSEKTEDTNIISEQEYGKVCDELNMALTDYNSEVKRFNDTLETFKSKNIANLPDKETEKQLYNPDYNAFIASGDDLSILKSEIESISGETSDITDKIYDLHLYAANQKIDEYNLLLNEYKSLLDTTSIDFISDVPEFKSKVELKENVEKTYWTEEKLIAYVDTIPGEIEQIIPYYLMVKQINNPSIDWVRERLKSVDGISDTISVTKMYDPNELLGKEGGYTGCLYFALGSIDQSSIPGNSLIDKGTDAGGAIEIFANKEDALKRCDYLSQFDGTVLYSGSYAIIGTMVVRTSYKLDTSEQIKVTDAITKKFTEIVAD